MLTLTPSQKGQQTEGVVLAALIRAGKNVLMPFGAHLRYDLVFEEEARFSRIQCKTAVVRGDCVLFRTCSRTNRVSKDYYADADFFGVYCPETNEVYLVPVAVAGTASCSLRLRPARNGQQQKVRMASEFVLAPLR